MDIQQLLDLRKVTQAISRRFETELKRHLATLAPLFSPLALFGEYARGGGRSTGLQGEKSYRELQTRFRSLAEQRPFLLNAPLSSPLDLFAATPVLTPLDYTHTARDGETEHRIRVASPLKWTLTHPDATPQRLRELAGGERSQSEAELVHALVQSLAMAIQIEQHPGLAGLFQDLRFPLQWRQLEGLGSLPVPVLSAPIETRLPEDGIIIQNTLLTGIPSFEEIIDLGDIHHLRDPVRDGLLALARSTSPALVREPAE